MMKKPFGELGVGIGQPVGTRGWPRLLNLGLMSLDYGPISPGHTFPGAIFLQTVSCRGLPPPGQPRKHSFRKPQTRFFQFQRAAL